ncbi:transmembrane protein 6/97 [Russula earlei]|uniref:Transmembrane protein 6/97 n=1 Tax=Russula earlei TaxID=71964 RepID=A0ACC0UCU5_9AGAM|nr:transmembrane protein 6/97 [Russula earlei]
MAARRPLSSRPLDLLYFIFFLVHIPATLLVDCQAIWPELIVPTPLRAVPRWYVSVSGDPLIAGAMGISVGNASELAWFKSFMYLEALFQLPVFVLGARGLWKDSPKIYALLVLYGASTCTTTLACIAQIINTPVTSAATVAQKAVSITPQQRVMLLFSYVPFFIVPLFLAIDMALRLQKWASVGIRALESSKNK